MVVPGRWILLVEIEPPPRRFAPPLLARRGDPPVLFIPSIVWPSHCISVSCEYGGAHVFRNNSNSHCYGCPSDSGSCTHHRRNPPGTPAWGRVSHVVHVKGLHAHRGDHVRANRHVPSRLYRIKRSTRLCTRTAGDAAHCIRRSSRIVRDFANDIANSRNEFASCRVKSATWEVASALQ